MFESVWSSWAPEAALNAQFHLKCHVFPSVNKNSDFAISKQINRYFRIKTEYTCTLALLWWYDKIIRKNVLNFKLLWIIYIQECSNFGLRTPKMVAKSNFCFWKWFAGINCVQRIIRGGKSGLFYWLGLLTKVMWLTWLNQPVRKNQQRSHMILKEQIHNFVG